VRRQKYGGLCNGEKHVQGLAKSLAADYASFGVTVNCVMPA
jgi:hypothetical protein